MAPEDREFPRACAARFRPVRRLAAGGFGAVWLAEQVALERRVAVKVLHEHALSDAETVARFVAEAKISAAIHHPNVVQVIDHGVDSGTPWIAYELVDGPALAARVAQGPVPWPEAFRITAQVARGLQAAHDLGILHRDIKPANVLESEAGHYKVTDFGIAKWAAHSAVQTAHGTILGTPAYIAPEQVTGQPPSVRTDLYALGTLLYELIAGRPPFAGDNLAIVLTRRLDERPERLPGPVPAAAEELVQRALAIDPARRFASAREFAEALALLGGDSGSADRPVLPPPRAGSRGEATRRVSRTVATAPAPRPAVRRRGRVVGVAALVVAVAFILTRRQVAPPPAPVPSTAPAARVAPADDPPRVLGLDVHPTARGVYFYVDLAGDTGVLASVAPWPGGGPAGESSRRVAEDGLVSGVIHGLEPGRCYALTLRCLRGGSTIVDRMVFRTASRDQEDRLQRIAAALRDPARADELIGADDIVRYARDVTLADALVDRIRERGDLPITAGHAWRLADNLHYRPLVKVLWKHPETATLKEMRPYVLRAAIQSRHVDASAEVRALLAGSLPAADRSTCIDALLSVRPPLVDDAERALNAGRDDAACLRLFVAVDPNRARRTFGRWLDDIGPRWSALVDHAITGLCALAADEDARAIGAAARREETGWVAAPAAGALSRLASPVACDELAKLVARWPRSPDVLLAVGAARASALAAPVVAALDRESDAAVRRAAAIALAGLPGAGRAELVRALSAPEPAVAEAAAWALGSRRETGVAEAVAAFARSPRDARGVGAWAQARVAGAAALPELARRFREQAHAEGAAARSRAVLLGQALVELGDASQSERSALAADAGTPAALQSLLIPRQVPGARCITVLGVAPREVVDLPVHAGSGIRLLAEDHWVPGDKPSYKEGRTWYPRFHLDTADAHQVVDADAWLVMPSTGTLSLSVLGISEQESADVRAWTPEDAPFVERIWLAAGDGDQGP